MPPPYSGSKGSDCLPFFSTLNMVVVSSSGNLFTRPNGVTSQTEVIFLFWRPLTKRQIRPGSRQSPCLDRGRTTWVFRGIHCLPHERGKGEGGGICNKISEICACTEAIWSNVWVYIASRDFTYDNTVLSPCFIFPFTTCFGLNRPSSGVLPCKNCYTVLNATHLLHMYFNVSQFLIL
jgi:hypothetical protein